MYETKEDVQEISHVCNTEIGQNCNMADVVCKTMCCATNLMNYSMSNGLCDCAKCAELEIQLQQVREELSSVQLIIQLLNKERVQGTTVTTPILATETNCEVDKDWEVMTQRGAKKKGQKVTLT